MLHEQTAAAGSSAQIVAAVRAAQAALFRRNLLLRVYQDRLLDALRDEQPLHVTAQHWNALNAHVRPEPAATCALYLLEVPASELSVIRQDEITVALANGALRGVPVPELARPYLLAQLLHRSRTATLPTEPYLGSSPAALRVHLRNGRDALGLPITTGKIIRGIPRQERLLKHLGLQLKEIESHDRR